MKGASPTFGSPAWAPAHEQEPHTSALKAHVAREWENQRVRGNRGFSQRACTKVSHTLSANAEASDGKEPGFNPLAGLEETIREAGGNFEHPWDIDTGDSHLEEIFLPGENSRWQASFWNPLSSLLAPRTYSFIM